MIRLTLLLACLLVSPALAKIPDFNPRTFSAWFDGPEGAWIETRYANGRRKVEGTFIRRKAQIVPHGPVKIWSPAGHLYQSYDAQTDTLTTWYPGGTIQREERAPLEPGGDYVSTRYYTSGQIRERTVERFNDAALKQRLELYYAFREQSAATPRRDLSQLRRSEHIQFRLKEGWHPNGARHFVARLDLTAPLETQTTWTWYDPSGKEAPSTRYFLRVGGTSSGASGWIKEGEHLEYHDNGQLQSRIEYKDGKLHGRVRRFAENGQRLEEGTYDRGELRGGARTIWSADGHVRLWNDGSASMSFQAGQLKRHAHEFAQGEFSVGYDASGAVTREDLRLPYSQMRRIFNPKHPSSAPTPARYLGELRDNRPFGRWTVLRADDSKVAEFGFDDRGRLSGPARQWFPDGQLAAECTFAAGQPHGVALAWFADGTRAAEATMVEGRVIGAYATWYADGRPREHLIQSATDVRVLGRWDAAGQPQVREIHEPAQGRYVTEFLHAGVVTRREYRYPGRETIDSNTHDAEGHLKWRTEHIDDDPKHTRTTHFWPSGARKSVATFRDRRAVGVFEEWHANGKIAKRGTSDSDGIQGVLQRWDADGKPLPDTRYVDGIEQITPKANDPCFCDKAAERPQGLIGLASRMLPLDALHAAQPGVTIEGYEETFLRWRGTYANLSGALISFGPLVAHVGGVRLVLNPCRHGTNLSEIKLEAQVTDDGSWVDLRVGTLGAEFSALRSLDGDTPYRMTAEVGLLSRRADGQLKLPDRRGARCVPPAKVGKTGLVLRPNGGHLSLETDRGRAAPALRVTGGRFEFTDAQGGVFHGQLLRLRVTGHGLSAGLGGAIDGPGGLDALARGLKAQGVDARLAGESISVRVGEPR